MKEAFKRYFWMLEEFVKETKRMIELIEKQKAKALKDPKDQKLTATGTFLILILRHF